MKEKGASMITKDELLKKMSDDLRTGLGLRLKKIVLIGSMARGDGTSESDYDCIVVVDEITSDLMEMLDVVSGNMLYLYNSVFSIIPVSEERYLEQKYNPLLINAGREGVTVWPTTI